MPSRANTASARTSGAKPPETVFATFDTYTEALLDEYQPDDFVYLTVERNQELFEDVETVVWRDEVPEKDG